MSGSDLSLTKRPHLPEKTQNCCINFNRSERCIDAKHATVAIVTALAIIAVLGSVLLVLAQQGYQLGEFNHWASLVEPHWLYVVLSGSLVVLTIDIVVMVAMTRSYLNKLYTEQELQKLGIYQTVKQQLICEKMTNQSYYLVNKPVEKANADNEGSPEAFVILFKDKNGKNHIIGCKTQEDQQAYLAKLVGYVNAETQFHSGPSYPQAYIQALLSQDPNREKIKGEIASFINTTRPYGYYDTQRFEIDGVSVDIVALNAGRNEKQPQIEFFFYKPNEWGSLFSEDSPYADYLNRSRIDRIIQEEMKKTRSINYLEDEEFTTLEMPYEAHGRVYQLGVIFTKGGYRIYFANHPAYAQAKQQLHQTHYLVKHTSSASMSPTGTTMSRTTTSPTTTTTTTTMATTTTTTVSGSGSSQHSERKEAQLNPDVRYFETDSAKLAQKQEEIIKKCKEEKLIEHIVVASGDYWVEEEQGMKVLFLRTEARVETRALADSDPLPSECTRDAKADFEALQQKGLLPQALGLHLAGWTDNHFKEREERMLPNEYWGFMIRRKTKEHGQYDPCSPLIIKNHMGEIQRFFFIREGECTQFLKTQNVTDGFARQGQLEKSFLSELDKKTGRFYDVVEYNEAGIAHTMTCNKADSGKPVVTHRGMPIDKLEDWKAEILAQGYVSLTDEEAVTPSAARTRKIEGI